MIARRFPNSTFVTTRVFCVASELKSNPRPVANARIVPVAISRSSISLPSSAIAKRASDAEHAEAEGDRDADQRCERRAREADVGQRVGGERVPAHDDEVAEHPRRERDERCPRRMHGA